MLSKFLSEKWALGQISLGTYGLSKGGDHQKGQGWLAWDKEEWREVIGQHFH